MTLNEIKETLEHYATQQPNVNSIVKSGNIYDISKDNYERKFSAFCVSEEPPHELDGDFITYNLVLVYTDRLTQDRSNTTEVKSVAIETITKVINKMKQLSMVDVTQATDITTFTERFSEECAGAYIGVRIQTTTESICEVVIKKLGEFAPQEFSDDFFKYIESL